MASSTTNDASEPIYFFSARERVYGIFSQWQKCTFTDPNYPGIKFNAAEQYMMFGKAQTFNDLDIAAKIILAKTSGVQKALGQDVVVFDEAVWSEVKLSIVERGNYLKFTQNDKFKKVLLDTGDKLLVEASKNDSVWGIGFTATTAKTVSREKWGQNLLGIALMNVRKKIRDEEAGEGDEGADESEEEVDDSDQEANDEEDDEKPGSATRKRKHDSIAIENSDDEPTEPKTATSKKARIGMVAEGILGGTESK